MNDVATWARTEREKVERDAMIGQPGWMEWLDGLSDEGRKIAVCPLLDVPTRERWCMFTMII